MGRFQPQPQREPSRRAPLPSAGGGIHRLQAQDDHPGPAGALQRCVRRGRVCPGRGKEEAADVKLLPSSPTCTEGGLVVLPNA
eukprot:366454-Chlamydomonas_euryale.AAC.13